MVRTLAGGQTPFGYCVTGQTIRITELRCKGNCKQWSTYYKSLTFMALSGAFSDRAFPLIRPFRSLCARYRLHCYRSHEPFALDVKRKPG